MSSRNDNSGEMMAFAVVAALFWIAFLLVYAVLLFGAFVFTVLSIIAWSRPFTMGKYTIEPHEAHAFVNRGVIGMFALPFFAAFCQALFNVQIEENIWPHLFLGGYALGSLVVGLWMESNAQQPIDQPPLPPQMPAPPEQPRPLPHAEPFRFASWDDEERSE